MENIHHLNIRLGIFFDGSGGNLINLTKKLTGKTIEHEYSKGTPEYTDADDDKLIYLLKMIYGVDVLGGRFISDKVDISEMQTYSNIVQLYQIYSKKVYQSEQALYQDAIYVEGVGTTDGESGFQGDNFYGMLFGRGKAGALAKYYRSTYYIRNCLESIIKQFPNLETINLTFDAFGFSRGSGIAWHFANKVNKQDDPIFQKNIVSYLESQKIKLCLPMSVNFLGLFETVVKVSRSRDLKGKQGYLDLSLPKNIAKHVFQITGRHECRENYPLSSIKSKYPEFEMLGCHTDIGGGYSRSKISIKSVLTKPVTVLLLLATIARRVERKKLNRVKSYPLFANMFKNAYLYEESDLLGIKKIFSGRVDRSVNGKLADASLYVMASVAIEEGIPFEKEAISSLEKSMDDALKEYALFSKQQAFATINKLSTQAFSNEMVRKIEAYVHFSSTWGDDPSIINALSISRPAKNYQREIYSY